jgi:hypothetical protein
MLNIYIMYKNKYLKYKLKYEQLQKNYVIFGGNNKNDYNESYFIKKFDDDFDLIGNNINFPMFFIKFSDKIENSLFEYLTKNKYEKIYVIYTSKISSIILSYFKILEKCKYCEFIEITKNNLESNELYDILPDNYKQIIFMDYLTQNDENELLLKIINNLENKNIMISDKYNSSNNDILKRINDDILYSVNYNTDPIEDSDFIDTIKNNIDINNNFLNLYDFINISSLYILNNVKNNDKIEFIKILTLTYIYYDKYLKIKQKFNSKFDK